MNNYSFRIGRNYKRHLSTWKIIKIFWLQGDLQRNNRASRTRDLLSHFYIPTVNALAGQGLVIDILGHAKEQLVAPEKMGGRLLGDQAHRLAQQFLTFHRIESLTFRRQQLVQLWIRIADARRAGGFEIL